jgi:hypothetical protein
MVSTAETETEKEKEQEEATASSEELPIMPWATSVARWPTHHFPKIEHLFQHYYCPVEYILSKSIRNI